MHLQDPHLLRIRAYVGGRWIEADSGAVCAIRNPATGSALVTVPDLAAAETRRAIEAAHAAFPAWAARSAEERAVLLRRWHALLMEHQEHLATLMTAERATRSPRHAGRSPTPNSSSNGLPRRRGASTVR